MGPSAIRYAGLEARVRALGRDVADWGDVRSPVPEAIDEGSEHARYLSPIRAVCEKVAVLVDDATAQAYLPPVLGGMARARGAGAALWIDAHGELIRPGTSPSGNVHGMPLAAALGAAGDEFASDVYPTPSIERAALIGIRSLDPGERDLIHERGIRVFTMNEVDRHGMERAVTEALDFLSGASFLHLSLDMDAVDPMFAPGVGTPVRGGLSYREAHLAMELLAESTRIDAIEVVEVNPVLDRENATAQLAVELVASALGARIL